MQMLWERLRCFAEIPSRGRVEYQNRPAQVLSKVAIGWVIPLSQSRYLAVWQERIDRVVSARISVLGSVGGPSGHFEDARGVGQHVPWEGGWCERRDQVAGSSGSANGRF